MDRRHALVLALAVGICLGSPICSAKQVQTEAEAQIQAEVEAASREEVFRRAAEMSQQADAAWKQSVAAEADKHIGRKERKRLKEEARRLTAEARPWNAKRDEYLQAENAALHEAYDRKAEEILASGKQTPLIYDLKLDAENYQSYTLQANGQPVAFRAYENLVYVAQPADAKNQKLSIYVPEAYFGKLGVVNGYTKQTAPIFMPNGAEGYLSSPILAPAEEQGRANASLRALAHGYVVVAPALRGRSPEVDTEGRYLGKALEAVIDYKAAVRYLRHNRLALPAGDTERIIASGTGTGGTLAALLGTTGNHPDYESFLLALNAAPCRDDVAVVRLSGPLAKLAEYAGTKHPVPDYRAAVHYLKLLEPVNYAADARGRKAFLFDVSQGTKSGETDKLLWELDQAGSTVEIPAGATVGDEVEAFFAHLDKVLQDEQKMSPILEKHAAAEQKAAEEQKRSAGQKVPAATETAVEQELSGVR